MTTLHEIGQALSANVDLTDAVLLHPNASPPCLRVAADVEVIKYGDGWLVTGNLPAKLRSPEPSSTVEIETRDNLNAVTEAVSEALTKVSEAEKWGA